MYISNKTKSFNIKGECGTSVFIEYLTAVKRIFNYLKGTLDIINLQYKSIGDTLLDYSDANFGQMI